MVSIDNGAILDNGSTYAEDDISSKNVVLSMAHDAVAAWHRAHGRAHNRQWVASLGSLVVEINGRGVEGRGEN
jgi:hypothetical protein